MKIYYYYLYIYIYVVTFFCHIAYFFILFIKPVSSFSPTPFEYRLSVLSFLGLIIVVVLMLLWGIIGIILIMVDMRRQRKQSLSANLKNHEEANDLIT